MGTQEAEEVPSKKRSGIENKIKREQYKIDQLLDRKEHGEKWHFQNETARTYRQTMVPFYLLQPEASKYPTYVDNSNIDKSLTDDFKIANITIRLSSSIIENIEKELNNSKAMRSPNLMTGRKSEGAGLAGSASQAKELLITPETR
jgi:hypothetical protein